MPKVMEVTSKSKGNDVKYSNRLELKTVYKILNVLHRDGSQLKTKLANKSKMSYTRFTPLANTLQVLNLIKLVEVAKRNCPFPTLGFAITPSGVKFLEFLENEK